jgi:hypothetical protein
VTCSACDRTKRVNKRSREPSDNVSTEVGARLYVDFIEGIGEPNANGGIWSMHFGTDRFSSKTGSVAVPLNSTIHAQLIRLVGDVQRQGESPTDSAGQSVRHC